MQAAESAPEVKPKNAIAPELRRAINNELLPLHAVASFYPPDPFNPGRIFEQKPALVVVRLPRANAGRPPRGGVYIQPPAFQRVRFEKASKHSKQRAKDGCFGSKKGAFTLWQKLALLYHGWLLAIEQMLARRERRAQLRGATA